MTTTTATYLADLRTAVRDLPTAVGDEIVAGITEELAGLSETDATERIAELGDPQFIAAAARDEVGEPAATTGPNDTTRTDAMRTDATWYTIVTAFALLLGGLVVPFAGWIVGAGFLWFSKSWTLRDKLIGTLVTPFGLLFSLLALHGAFATTLCAGDSCDTNLSMPVWAIALRVIVALLPFATFAYLLVRARRLKARA